MPAHIAYLAEGKLYVKQGALAARLIESAFAQGVIDRAVQNRERHDWKSHNSLGGAPLWFGNRRAEDSDLRTIHFTGLTRGSQAGEIIYALDTGHVGGLFTYDIASDSECRLFHKQEFRAQDLARHPTQDLIALSVPEEDGSAHIGLMQTGGKGLRRITEGDVLDQAPFWAPGETSLLVYQSAGLARTQTGIVSAVGPYAIHQLDLDREKFTTLMEDGRYDYLLPRRTADGALYFIRRPYTAVRSTSPLALAGDILLFPFRLARAIYAFLNLFSVFFAGKPLTTAGGPQQKMDTRHMMLWGRLIDAEKAVRASKKGTPAALVPNTWELLRLQPDGSLQPLAKGVLSFDIAADGTVIYTNGSEVFTLGPDGAGQRLCAQHMIQQVLAIN